MVVVSVVPDVGVVLGEEIIEATDKGTGVEVEGVGVVTVIANKVKHHYIIVFINTLSYM